MNNWVKLPDGTLINLNNVVNIYKNNTIIVFENSWDASRRIYFTSHEKATEYLEVLAEYLTALPLREEKKNL